MRKLWLAAVLALYAGVAAADTAVLSWVNPTTYTDGTALAPTDIVQTNLQCSAVIINGARQACSLSPTSVAPATTTYNWAFTVTSATQVCFQAQTQTTNGAVSAWSTEGCHTVASAPKTPAAPALTVQ